MEPRTFTLVHAAPVPVGHRVEIGLIKQTAGVFKKVEKLNLSEVVLRDLDSGIEFASEWHYQKSMGVSTNAHDPQTYPQELRSDLEMGETITGKVLQCRVITVMAGSIWRVQTTITVQPDG